MITTVPNSPTQVAAAAGTLTFRTLDASRVHEALAIWRQLELRVGETAVACSATWTECWLQVYGGTVPYRFLVAESAGIVRGICLLTNGVGQKVGPVTIKTLHLGTAGEPQPGSVCVEYNRLLVEPAFRHDFISEIVTALKSDSRWEQLRLDGFSESDLQPWLAHLPNAEVRSRDSRYFDLQVARIAGSDVLTRLGKSTRSNLRRRLKQYGELDCQWAVTPDDAGDILQELIQLHQARWQAVGQPGAFASERFQKFQTEASLKLFLEGKAVLFRVRHAGATVGCLLLLNDRNRLLDYLSGFASFDEKPSPGLISHYLCMEAALKRGYEAYDFLVGDKRHKDNLSSDVNQLCWLTWSRPTIKLRALQLLRDFKRRMQSETPAPASASETAE
ncbi:GNAT family N-acetyltransferase [Planctomicrobium piriforme]|uniref:Acetyltransferase (GNAT) domain-containing protein n=1 Tax=Planctomicrobium piriforme TaxID=1576369 RepID=A0A1I3CAS0_9PLAN|nr:GNAT family N-acetyltransferase [Planctomicrobium piriforme]SFH71618.1 Acetyltransferase (GNAT) domain-containing protein [Planctomicrobium piriforme]